MPTRLSERFTDASGRRERAMLRLASIVMVAAFGLYVWLAVGSAPGAPVHDGAGLPAAPATTVLARTVADPAIVPADVDDPGDPNYVPMF